MKKFNIDDNATKNRLVNSILDKLPWKYIKEYVLQNPILLENFKRGGFELKAKNKSHAINIILSNLTEKARSDLFFIWYKNISEHSDLLDDYFNSDEYKKWMKSKKLENGEYALPNPKFYKLCFRLSKQDAQVFLYLSPIKFSEEQIQLLLEIPDEKRKNNNEYLELLKKYNKAQEKIGKIESVQSRLKRELSNASRDRSLSDKLKIEAENLKKQIKKVQFEKSELQKEIESTSKLAEHKMIEMHTEYEKEKNNALLKVEELKILLNQAKKQIEIKEKLVKALQLKVEKYEKEKDDFFCIILDKIDIHELISEINEPDEVKELLEKIVKIPEKDEPEGAGGREMILKDFWENSLRIEEKILNKILTIDASSVKEGDYFKDWGEHADDFIDLKHTLRAKIVLINLLYEILRKQL